MSSQAQDFLLIFKSLYRKQKTKRKQVLWVKALKGNVLVVYKP